MAARRQRVPLALALLACLLLGATAELPQLSEPGGPGFLDSVLYSYGGPDSHGGINRSGAIANSTFAFAIYTHAGVIVQRGKYISWECVSTQSGAYRAILEYTTIFPNGTDFDHTVCEYGLVNRVMNSHSWAWSKDGCPDGPDDTNYMDWYPTNVDMKCGRGDEGAAADSSVTFDKSGTSDPDNSQPTSITEEGGPAATAGGEVAQLDEPGDAPGPPPGAA